MFDKGFSKSGCSCCKDCDKHKLNPRYNYVVPCDDRRNCDKFNRSIEDTKLSNKRYAEESKQYADILGLTRGTKRHI